MLLNHLPPLLSALLALFPAQQDPGDLGDVEVPEGVAQEEGDYLILKFDETENPLSLKQFIKICQLNTGLNFTLHEQAAQLGQLDKPILLYGEKRIRKEEFYPFFQTMMKINGFVCVPQGSGALQVIMITPVNATTQPVVKAGAIFVDPDDVEEFADQPGVWIATVVQLKYAQAQGLGTSLRTALGGGATGQDAFMPLQTVNALLIQNFGPFAAAAVRLVKRLDVREDVVKPSFAKIYLQHASAEELAELLKDLLEESSGPGGQPRQVRGRQQGGDGTVEEEIESKILPYTRDNSLLVTASEDNLERIKDLVAQLDTRIETPETKFRVYVLQNISARELAEDLRDYLQRTQQAEEQALRTTGQSGAQAARQAEQRVVVVGQEETNSLLVTATRTRWAELKSLLDRLDQRQPQVLIETALIEVSEDFTRDIGFEYAAVQIPEGNNATGFGFTAFGLSTVLDTDMDGLPDTRVPAAADGLTAGILDGRDFGIPLLIRAAQTDNTANVLSIPSILVTNNRGARIESIDEIPVTEQNAVANVGITESFADFQEAGIKLEITPSISSKRYLRLDLNLEISAFRGTFVPGSVVPPPRITRNIRTTVYLPDGATMWIGGVIRDDLAVDESGIPILSDIPVFGWLFGRTTDQTTKTTLFFFCTPRILDDFMELADLSTEGKSQAAETIGLDRLRKIDPTFEFDNPLDVILDQDLDGDGAFETGMLDMNTFSSPRFIATGGETSPQKVGADPSRFEGVPVGAEPAVPAAVPASASQRNLPESGR